MIVGAWTGLSRILGVARDIVCACFFGASGTWDTFVVAFTVPNLFRQLFGEGALASAFVPAFAAKPSGEAGRLLRSLVGWMVRILGALAGVGAALCFAFSLAIQDQRTALIFETLCITFPYLLLVCIGAILGGALNVSGRFAAPAAGPVLLNVALIAGALAASQSLTPRHQLWILASSVLAGGVLALAVQIPPLWRRYLAREGTFPVGAADGDAQALGVVLSAFLPAAAGLAVIQANELLDILIARTFIPSDGAVSAVYYANRLNQLPLGVIGFSVATAVFPRLSRAAARRDTESFRDSLGAALRLALGLAIPAAAGLAALSPDITSLVFERGKFDAAATVRTFPVVVAYAAGIPFFAANMVLARAFYARGDMKTPVRVGLATAGLNLALNLALVFPLAEAGIALATSITGFANFVLFARRIEAVPAPPASWVARSLLAAALAAGSACLVARLGSSPWTVLAAVAAGSAVYVLAALALGLARSPDTIGAGRARSAPALVSQ